MSCNIHMLGICAAEALLLEFEAKAARQALVIGRAWHVISLDRLLTMQRCKPSIADSIHYFGHSQPGTSKPHTCQEYYEQAKQAPAFRSAPAVLTGHVLWHRRAVTLEHGEWCPDFFRLPMGSKGMWWGQGSLVIFAKMGCGGAKIH